MVNSIYVHVSWDSSKTENGEALITIIRLNNTSNHVQCLFVLVLWAKVMKWWWWWRISIWSCVINCTNQRDTPTTSQIVNKSWYLKQIESINWQSCTVCCVMRGLSTCEFVDSCFYLVQFDPTHSTVNTELNVSVFVRVAKLRHRISQASFHWISCVSQCLSCKDSCIMICTPCTTRYPYLGWDLFRTHSHAPCLHIVDVSPLQMECSNLVGLLDWFCPEDNSSTVLFTLVL